MTYTVTSVPAGWSVSVSGASVTLTAFGSPGTATLKYQATDPLGAWSPDQHHGQSARDDNYDGGQPASDCGPHHDHSSKHESSQVRCNSTHHRRDAGDDAVVEAAARIAYRAVGRRGQILRGQGVGLGDHRRQRPRHRQPRMNGRRHRGEDRLRVVGLQAPDQRRRQDLGARLGVGVQAAPQQ